jgi:penicillin-binding protein 1B
VDDSGNFVCGGGMRSLPVWTTNPDSLCQQSQPQQPGNPFDSNSQPQQPQQQQQQPPQQQNEKKDSDGVAGWIKDMFGSN